MKRLTVNQIEKFIQALENYRMALEMKGMKSVKLKEVDDGN